MLVFKRYQNHKKEHILILEKNKLISQQKKQLDNALIELQEMNINLEKKVEEVKINRARLTMLIKIIRHDLSNDLIVIRSALRLYKDNSKSEMLDEISKRIEKSLSTISLYRKYESFIGSNANLDEIEISEILNKLMIKFSKIKFNMVGNCKVFADSALESVFTNLISNSIQHGKASEIDMKISTDKDMCEIRFADNGHGIPDKIKNKIFDEGYSYGISANTGIGLYIVKQLINEYY